MTNIEDNVKLETRAAKGAYKKLLEDVDDMAAKMGQSLAEFGDLSSRDFLELEFEILRFKTSAKRDALKAALEIDIEHRTHAAALAAHVIEMQARE